MIELLVAMKFPLDWLLLNRWFWIIVLCCWAVVIGPLFFISLLIFLPAPFNVGFLIVLIVGWSVAAGYKDWVLAKRNEEKTTPKEFQLP